MSETATPGQWDLEREARQLLLDHGRDSASRREDAFRAALQRAHDAGATGAQAKLEPAREALTKLLAMAQKPMKSWDSGWCIEAERVGEIAAEALEALA